MDGKKPDMFCVVASYSIGEVPAKVSLALVVDTFETPLLSRRS
jgi:hypothetical protein